MNERCSIGEALRAAAASDYGLRFIEQDGRSTHTPYRALLDEACVIAGALQSRGCVPDDRVALVIPEVGGFVRAFFGIVAAGLVLASADGEREVALADYFTGYRQTLRRADELIKTIRIPRPLAPVTGFHKIAKRPFDDISSVAVAFALDIADGTVTRARIGLGGVAATPIRALATEQALAGASATEDGVREASQLAAEGTNPPSDLNGAADYRQHLARVLTGRAVLKAAGAL